MPASLSLYIRDALVPFDPAELERLRRYARKAEFLRCSEFFRQPQSFSPVVNEDGVVSYTIGNASAEMINAITPPLRLFYSQRDNISFARIGSMVGLHASQRATVDSAALLGSLKAFRQRLTEILSEDPDMGMYTFKDGAVTARHKPSMKEIFEDWLYGEYLHDDEARIARIEAWRGIGIHEFLFLSTARSLGAAYIDFASDVVEPILAELSLHPAP
jgi:hypothetical protein